MFAKTFRNSLIASTLLVGASILASPAAFAQVVSGTVATANTVTFDGDEGTAIVPGVARPAYPLGTLDIQNNDPDGWTLTVSSANGGKLTNATTHDIVYTAITLADIPGVTETSATPTLSTTAASQLSTAAFSESVANGVTSIAVTASISDTESSVPPETYSDTLTFTLTSN